MKLKCLYLVSQPVKPSALRLEADQHHALLMIQREEENQREIAKLKDEIKNLKLELFRLKNNPTLISDQMLPINPNASTTLTQQQSAPYQLDCTNYIRRQVGNAEILHGLPMNNEYELIPFNHFTFSRVYPIDLGLGKRVVEKPIGYKRKDLLDALNRALESLNKNATVPNHRYTLDDFIEGIYRNEPVTGTQYELYFRTKEISNKTNPSPSSSHHNDHGTTKIIVMRPFAPLQTIQVERFPKTAEKEIIHIILPLSGRISTFQGFMEKFVKIALKNDRRVQLTVVYFGEDGLADARQIMKRIIAQKSAYSSNLNLLALNETFSRGKIGFFFLSLPGDRHLNLIAFFLFHNRHPLVVMQQKVFALVLSKCGMRTRVEGKITRTCYCLCAMWTLSSALNSSTVADGTQNLIVK